MKFLKCGACLVTFALLAGCIIPYPHTSQRSPEFSGTVLDARTHQPIRGAKVFLSQYPKVSCTTDAAGHFRLKETRNFHLAIVGLGEGHDWPPGAYVGDMVATHPGYLTSYFWRDKREVLLQPKP